MNSSQKHSHKLAHIQYSCSLADDMVENARMTDVGLVVLDEVHYLGDVDRGSVWEEVIISCPRRIPLLCMSATIRNPDELGGWISKVSFLPAVRPYTCSSCVSHYH